MDMMIRAITILFRTDAQPCHIINIVENNKPQSIIIIILSHDKLHKSELIATYYEIRKWNDTDVDAIIRVNQAYYNQSLDIGALHMGPKIRIQCGSQLTTLPLHGKPESCSRSYMIVYQISRETRGVAWAFPGGRAPTPRPKWGKKWRKI